MRRTRERVQGSGFRGGDAEMGRLRLGKGRLRLGKSRGPKGPPKLLSRKRLLRP
jgi:hypothetical protein